MKGPKQTSLSSIGGHDCDYYGGHGKYFVDPFVHSPSVRKDLLRKYCMDSRGSGVAPGALIRNSLKVI